MPAPRPSTRASWARRAGGTSLALGLLLLPVAAGAGTPRSTTTTTKPHRSTTTTTTTTPPSGASAAVEPTPAQTQAAADLLDRVQRMTTTLDALDARYLSAIET